ncbi:nuclear envelope integral membrane protein 1b-like [Odontomachus brunneus]|uniref:nuclear envelope integral membrane protein 1b-like n=1 Tax=Odontomachus brunneus TaxID=486640 RepID=UPI0013F1A0A6|nr:nuclear envelope integral membrane protein 1b-like [Odontomachus brunneus]
MKNMTELTKCFFVFFCLLKCAYTLSIIQEQGIYYLNVSDSIENKYGLKIYCHTAESKHLRDIWKIMTMHLNISNSEQYTLYRGKTPDEIDQKHEKKSFDILNNMLFLSIQINPFEDTCIGVYIHSSNESRYIMSMTETNINSCSFTMMVTGILIFWFAKILSQEPNFYYACCTLFGIIKLILISIYKVRKWVQKVSFEYFITRAVLSFLLALFVFEDLIAHLISEPYVQYIILYIIISSSISFMICYGFDPVINTRTKQIIQWFLQTTGLVLVYYSSYLREASLLCFIVLVLVQFVRCTIF